MVLRRDGWGEGSSYSRTGPRTNYQHAGTPLGSGTATFFAVCWEGDFFPRTLALGFFFASAGVEERRFCMTKSGLRDEKSNTRAVTLPSERQASSVQELRAEVTDAADAPMGLPDPFQA